MTVVWPRAFLFDLDGTLWDGDDPAPGAVAFLEQVRRRGVDHLFLSNNSWQAPAEVAARLRRMGIVAEEDQVLTAGAAAGPLIREALGPSRLMLLGTPALGVLLAASGHACLDPDAGEPCDGVVVGLAPWPYSHLSAACAAVAAGHPLIAVNLDRSMPGTGGALVPKPGALVAAIRTAVPEAPPPLVVGKPAPPLFRQALARLGLPPGAVMMVGDGLETDIAGGQACGLRTAWLHRNRHPRSGSGAPAADIAVPDLTDWMRLIEA